MRKFADVHLACPFQDEEEFRALLGRARKMGFHVVSVPLDPDLKTRELSRLKEIASEIGLDLATRVDLAPENRPRLLSSLRRLRRKFEFIGVLCQNKEVARVAARDRRVDFLMFPLEPKERYFDRSEAELASGSNCALEIDLMPVFKLPLEARIKLLARLREEVALAKKYGVPVVICSGAPEPIMMRRPRELAYLATILDLGFEDALDALSKTPLSMLERNRAKLDPSFVAPGIRVVRRGRDCP